MMLPLAASPRRTAGQVLILLVLAAWAYLYRLDTPALFDDPNDAQYAEVAREMFESGEWISPQLDYVLFLNKPPLSYWLIALSFEVLGVSEFAARLPGALAAIVLLLLTWQLGRALWGTTAGWWSAGVLLATPSLMVEARFVRPDLLLTTAVAGALLAGTRLARAPRPSDCRAALIGFQVALAGGLLAKGIVGLFVPAAALALATLVSGNFRVVAALLSWRAWWMFILLVVPWHLVAALRHPGFAWDYIVNQHLLFFLDRKLPRDSEGIPLWQFWSTFGLRLFPWTLFVPFAVHQAWPADGGAERSRWAAGLVLGWGASVMVLFSATASRLEHYSVPAVPACALLVAGLFARADQRQRTVFAAHMLPLACLGLAAPFALPHILAGQEWLAAATDLPALARVVGLVFAVGAVSTLALLIPLRGLRVHLAPLPLIAAMWASAPLVQHGLTLVAPVNSSASLAGVINAVASEADTVVYEAPMEYQSGAGLFFYTRRKWWILRPTGFMAPPYLVPHEGELFITRAELTQRWRSERIFLISDPLQTRSSMNGVVPEPFWIVARAGTRWLVRSRK